MSSKELACRFLGFLVPWLVFTALQYYVLNIQSSFNLMMYGGIAGITSLTIRDILLDKFFTAEKNQTTV